jgi:FlaA1/EpsC-like NDP-sugar epimerase
MSRSLDDATVLITGGTGSLGQTLVRRLLQGGLGNPRRIIVFSRDEAKQYAMKTTWKHAQGATEDVYYGNFDEIIEFWVGDVRDPDSVNDVMGHADVVFHAAALKQVPSCEYFLGQAVATNVRGAENVVRAARRSERTHSLLAVSTDKACKPINVMGMTKALQERIVTEGNLPLENGCRMLAVRYGNVLESRGSVIPLFRSQIAAGGPVTITLPEMTRFLLSLDSAVDTIFAAYREGRAGEIFVPRVPSARIVDIAAAMIGERPIETVVTGIRPGEKIHEVLVSEEEAFRTVERAGHYVVQSALPELQDASLPIALDHEFSSGDAVVTGAAVHDLLAQADFVDQAMGQVSAAP